MAHILVTGGAGFIGSHLVERLLAAGDRVTVIDDLSTGSAANLATVRDHPLLQVRYASVLERDVMAEAVDLADSVVHLAAAVGVRLIVESPVRTIETNVKGTEAVLEFACKKGTPVLVASTSEVYGKSAHVPYNETADLLLGPPDKGRWSYACSKLLDEFLALAYHRERDLPVRIVRFFNTVGPRQTGRYGMVVPTFVRQALTGEAITVFGTGEQSRCFTHVLDAVEALTRLMQCEKALGQVVNIGGCEEISILGLAERVRETLDSDAPIRKVPYDEAYERGFEDMMRRVPDTTRLHDWVDFTPTRGLDEIIRDVAAHWQATGNAS